MDLLVEFEEGREPGWEIVTIEEALSGLLGGRPVDMVNPKFLNHRIRDRILAKARTLYERA